MLLLWGWRGLRALVGVGVGPRQQAWVLLLLLLGRLLHQRL